MIEKKCIVLGAGGFIGGHLVTRLKSKGNKKSLFLFV